MKPWEKNFRRVVPYIPGEQPNVEHMIKLNTNENPYPPGKGVEKALKELDGEQLRRYPDPDAGLLVQALADYYKIDKGQVFVGVGSDDVLAVAFMTFFHSKKPVVFPNITYSFYDVWAGLFDIPYRQPALDSHFRIRREDYYEENGGVVIANPNAPTGIYEDLGFLRDILDHNQDVVVVVDEAYIDFGGDSALSLVKEYENLLVVQTFSKSRSMAGMRIGYAMGHPGLIRAMENVKYSYNSYTMNLPSIYAGAQAVKDDVYFRETLDKIINTRERVKRELGGLGFSFPDSRANFLFLTHETLHAKDLLKALRRENIFVRHFDKPKTDNYLRVTIGTDKEMDRFLDVVGACVRSGHC